MLSLKGLPKLLLLVSIIGFLRGCEAAPYVTKRYLVPRMRKLEEHGIWPCWISVQVSSLHLRTSGPWSPSSTYFIQLHFFINKLERMTHLTGLL